MSQSPDEDSLSSDAFTTQGVDVIRSALCLNPLTRIHCLPTQKRMGSLSGLCRKMSQSPDEDSLSSDSVDLALS